jgi:hypothetical protein
MGVPCFGFPQAYRGPELHSWPDAHVEVGRVLFVLGRREDSPCNCGPCTEARKANPQIACNIGRYHIQGIFTEERLAVECAFDETYFVGPLPVNQALPHKIVEWAGLYFPLAVRVVYYPTITIARLFADEYRPPYLIPVGRIASLFIEMPLETEVSHDSGPPPTG